MWPGVYPAAGQLNDTYLTNIFSIIDKAGKAGIYTLVDMH
jgi:endoglycosylceramidase